MFKGTHTCTGERFRTSASFTNKIGFVCGERWQWAFSLKHTRMFSNPIYCPIGQGTLKNASTPYSLYKKKFLKMFVRFRCFQELFSRIVNAGRFSLYAKSETTGKSYPSRPLNLTLPFGNTKHLFNLKNLSLAQVPIYRFCHIFILLMRHQPRYLAV